MISSIVVDDEPVGRDIIKEYILRSSFLEFKGGFRSAVDALAFLAENKVDIIFLDINMPELNGVQLTKLLPAPRPLVIFCTAYAQYAVESYDLEALDYLLKPVEFDRFMKAALKAKIILDSRIDKAVSSLQKSQASQIKVDYVLIKSGTEIKKIELTDISYIEGTGNYATIQTSSKRVMTLQSLKEFVLQLPEEDFFRIHKSYIISFKNLETIENHQVKIGNKFLPIGHTYRNEFRVWLERKRISNKP